jgi:hypothetical protein
MGGISSQQKEGCSKKEKRKKKKMEQGLKSKRGKTSFEKIHVSKRKKKKER